MKKKFKYLLTFILGGIIFSGITVFAINYTAKDITFTPKNSNWKVTNVEDAMNDLLKEKKSLENIEKLWVPVGSTQNIFAGTYTFEEKYSYVLVICYTNSSNNTRYSVSDMNEIYKEYFGRYNESTQLFIYKDVEPGAKVNYSINNLDRAGIGVFGIK